MDRRSAARHLLVLAGMPLMLEPLLSGCVWRRPSKEAPFSTADVALLDTIADTIIPATDTPGAAAVGAGACIADLATDCFDDDTRLRLRHGLTGVEAAANQRFGRPFGRCTAEQRTAIITDVDREQREYTARKPVSAPPHYFWLLKRLAVIAYFTSETGCTRVLRYVEAPGSYHGDISYVAGDRAWFDPARRVG